LAQDASLRQYIGAGITFFLFSFYLSVSILSAVSVLPISPSPSPSPSLSPSTSFRYLYFLDISFSLISLSPSITQKKQNIQNVGKNLQHFAFSWGIRLKIVVYLVEAAIH
jgi:hypothetical protein